MVHFSTLVVLISSLAVFASPLDKRTVAQVEADIAAISTDVTNLDNAINGFPNSGGTLAQALSIHNNSTTLAAAISKGTADVTSNGALSQADGTTILKSIEAFEPTVLNALSGIVTKMPALAALPLGGVTALVKQDLGILNGNTTAFEAALIAAAPAALRPNATAIKTALDAAFSKALAAYANA